MGNAKDFVPRRPLSQERYLDNSKDFDPTGRPLQLMLQTQSHQQRLALFKELLTVEHLRLGAKISLKKMFGNILIMGCFVWFSAVSLTASRWLRARP